MSRWLSRHLVAVVGVCAIAGYAWLVTRPSADPRIRSDGYNYYLYAPSWLVYHDVSLEALSADWNGGVYPDFAGMVRWPGTNRWLNRHPIGVALLMLPFVGLADLLTRWSNFPRDGFSFYYQHAAALAGLSYFLAGLALLRRTLLRSFSAGVTVATLAVITFGTNAFHYAVYDATFSHAFSFALICALVECTDGWWTHPRRWHVLAVGALAALIVLVRHTNVVLLLLIPLWHIDRITELPRRLTDLIGMAATFAIGVAPQLAYYHWVTGHWIVNAYAPQGLGFNFLAPHVYGALFSTERGLFFWSPVLLCAIVGFFVARGWARRVLPAAATVMVLNAWVIASWSEWQYGASFGHRAFVDSLGLLAPFLAACFAWIADRPRIMVVAVPLIAVASVLSLIQMIQFWLHVWPTRDITWAQYRALFLSFR